MHTHTHTHNSPKRLVLCVEPLGTGSLALASFSSPHRPSSSISPLCFIAGLRAALAAFELLNLNKAWKLRNWPWGSLNSYPSATGRYKRRLGAGAEQCTSRWLWKVELKALNGQKLYICVHLIWTLLLAHCLFSEILQTSGFDLDSCCAAAPLCVLTTKLWFSNYQLCYIIWLVC